MSAFRKFCCAVVTVLLAAVALPAFAGGPQKSYNAEFLLPPFDTLLAQPRTNPAYDGAGQLIPPVAVTVGIKNESPPATANSNISSFQFQVVGLSLLGGSGDISCPNAQCTVDVNTGTVYVTNISKPIQATQTFTVTFHASSCVALNDGFIQNVTVYTGSQLNGQTFVPFAGPPDPVFPMQLTLSDPTTIEPTAISCGPSNCGDNLLTQNSLCTGAGTETNCVASFRSADKNGVCAASVSYFVTNMLLQFNQMHFVWETDPAAVFAYQASVKPVAPNTMPAWQVGWLPTSGSPVFVDAPVCLGANTSDWPLTSSTKFPFPAKYGTLASAASSTDKKLTVTVTGPAAVPAPPFPITVDGERMTVTKVTTNSWTVTRAVGGTVAPPVHALNANVMSTPLPLLSGTLTAPQKAAGYFVGQQAQQCRASLSNDNGDGTFSTWIIDIGDGWTLGR